MRFNKKNDRYTTNRIVQKQSEEIKRLKTEILRLEKLCSDKDEKIKSAELYRDELNDITKELKGKRGEYDDLLNELRTMKSVMNQRVFKGRWKLIRLLMK